MGRAWEVSRNHAPGLDPSASSAEVNPVHETDGAAVAVCFDKKGFARFLGLSVRSLDRINAEGRLPAPDFVLGRSARWSPWTVRKWLQSRPHSQAERGLTMAERISMFAEEMVPSLAEMAGQWIARTRKINAEERETAIDALFEQFKIRHQDTAKRFLSQLHASDSVVHGIGFASGHLLYDAFRCALNEADVWDRRLSARTITSKVKAGMLEHICDWAQERGIYRMWDGGDS